LEQAVEIRYFSLKEGGGLSSQGEKVCQANGGGMNAEYTELEAFRGLMI